jgi:hypothetical protein
MTSNNLSNKRAAIMEQIDEETELMFLEPAHLFDDAIIGISEPRGEFPPLVIYDSQRIVELLQEHEGMDWADAQEFYEYNISGAWMGNQTPLYVERV